MCVANGTRNLKRLHASTIDTASWNHNKHVRMRCCAIVWYSENWTVTLKHISNKLNCQHISVRLTKRRPALSGGCSRLSTPMLSPFAVAAALHGFRTVLRPKSNRNIKSDRIVNRIAKRILSFFQSHLVAHSFFENHTINISSDRTTKRCAILSNALKAFTWFCWFNCDYEWNEKSYKITMSQVLHEKYIQNHCLFFSHRNSHRKIQFKILRDTTFPQYKLTFSVRWTSIVFISFVRVIRAPEIV